MNTYNSLASRDGFNQALRHFKAVGDIAADISEGYNLADIIQAAIAESQIEHGQVRAIVSALLKEKFNYAYSAINLSKNIEKAEKMASIFEKWSNLQIVLAYFDPNSGIQLINPSIKTQLEATLPFLHDELLVIYVDVLSGVSQERKNQFLSTALQDIAKVLYGGTVTPKKGYGGFRKRTIEQVEAPPVETDTAQDTSTQPAAAAPSGPTRLTPRYSVFVTNELFHNGNVEAWKKIIQAYNHKYPDNEVLIWYENERINDINTLFKWGKVKHGTPIVFSIRGSEFKEISKLQRYLFEGASPRFENFLTGAPNQILDIF